MSDVTRQTENEITNTKREGISKFQSYDIEIDLLGKARELWGGRRTILLFVAVCISIAIFHTSFGPTEYTSTSSLIQESEGASVGDFGSSFLRTLTGLNISSGSNANMSAVATGRAPLPVTLYPRIINSTEFQKELIYTELEFSTLDSTLTLFDYFHNHRDPALRDRVYTVVGNMTIYLPFTVLQWGKSLLGWTKNAVFSLFRDDAIASDTKQDTVEVIPDERLQSVLPEEKAVMDWLTLKIVLASEGGIMDISTTLPDPKAAALVNAELVEYIQEYIKEYRVKKAQQNLDDTLERYEIARDRYYEAESELAEYQDANLNISKQSAAIEEGRLSNEASLRYSIYNSVAQEVEQARMVVQQQIPVFNPLEKPNVPSSSDAAVSPLVIVFAGVIGLFLGTALVFIRNMSLFK